MLPLDQYARALQSSMLPSQIRHLGSPDRRVYARCSMGAGLTLTNGVYTLLQYDTVDVDTHGMITPGASWAATMPMSGVLRFSLRLIFAQSGTWTPGDQGVLRMDVNSLTLYLDFKDYLPASSVRMYLSNSGEIDVVTGDVIKFYALNSSGGNLAVGGSVFYNWMTLSIDKSF